MAVNLEGVTFKNYVNGLTAATADDLKNFNNHPIVGAEGVKKTSSVVNKSISVKAVETSSRIEYNGVIDSYGSWLNAGKHIVIPVNGGDIFYFTPKSLTAQNCVYAFVTSSYVPGDHTSGVVPFAGAFGRILSAIGSECVVVVPSNAAYLLLETVDGGGNRVVFEAYGQVEKKDFIDYFSKDRFSKKYFLRQINLGKYLNYSGIVGNESSWVNAGRHIAVPVMQGDVIELKPSRQANVAFVDGRYVPGNHTSGYVPFSSVNAGRITIDANVKMTLTAGADSSYLIVHVKDGGGNNVDWEINKTITSDESKEIVEDSSRTFFEHISIDSVTTYGGSLGSSGGWFGGGRASHKPIPVVGGDILRLSTKTNYHGYYAFVTSSYVPGDHTSGAVPFAGTETNRFEIDGNDTIEISVPNNAAYIILVVYDGASEGCIFELSVKRKELPVFKPFTRIKYAHWNIGNFSMGKSNSTTIFPEDKNEKIPEYRSFINSVKPDVLAVCEDNPEFSTDGTLAVDAIYSCFEQKHPGYKSGYMMNSFYSNGLKILQFSSQAFPSDISNGYGFSEMLVDIDGDTAIMCEAHLTWSDYEKRTAQIQYLVDRYEENNYVVISADWNIGEENYGPTEEEEMQPLVDSGYRLSMMDYMPKESTYSGNDVTPAKNAALDIICAKGFGIVGASVNMDCGELSDHRLVVCDLVRN